MRVRQRRGVEQRHVGRVGDDALVEQERVGELAVGADPDELARRALRRVERVDGLDVAHVDRALARQPALHVLGERRSSSGAMRSRERRQRLGVGRLGHRQLMLEPVLVGLERRREVEDRAARAGSRPRGGW